MRVRKISITNFKGIDCLEFEPKMINLIVGKNNTGKTSLCEGIDIVVNTQNIRRHYDKHFSKLINVQSQQSVIKCLLDDKETILELKKINIQTNVSEFKRKLIDILKKKIGKDKLSDEVERELEKLLNTLVNDELITELSKEGIIVVKDKSEKTYFSFTSKLYKLSRNLAELISKNLNERFKIRLREGYFLERVIDSLIVFPPRYFKESESNVIYIKSLKLNGKEEINAEEAIKVLEIEERIKENKILVNLEGFGLDFLVFKYDGKKEAIPYDFMGDGFKSIVGFFWHLSSKNIRGKVVLIEEPENRMHPAYIQQLIQFIIKFSKEKNVQFFITTHSIDIIDLLFEENLSMEEKKYLEKELLILRMEKTKNYITSEAFDYGTAKSKKENLLIDLRGN